MLLYGWKEVRGRPDFFSVLLSDISETGAGRTGIKVRSGGYGISSVSLYRFMVEI